MGPVLGLNLRVSIFSILSMNIGERLLIEHIMIRFKISFRIKNGVRVRELEIGLILTLALTHHD
jgi:hypothetical protein